MGAGAGWRARREELGLSLDEAAARTKISRRYLEGIEEGNYDGWPARVFSTGYIRAYAQLLGTDPEPVLSEYLQAAAGKPVPEHGRAVPPAWVERRRRRENRRRPYLVAGVVLFVVGIGLAYLSARMAAKAPLTPAAAPGVPPMSGAAPAVPGGGPRPEEGTRDNAASPGGQAGAGPTEPAVSEQSAGGSVSGGGAAAAPLQLFLEASELTWLMYSLDGGEPVDVMLYPGDRLNMQAQSTIYLKLGNAGGVVGTLNGRLLSPFGKRGEVREIRLNR